MNTSKVLQGFFLMSSILMISSCSGRVKDVDGNYYKAEKIGNQKWMTENLSVSHFRNGDAIPESKSIEEWIKSGVEGKPAWCFTENDQGDNKKSGKLYNWYAVNDPRGLAPRGWHVPSDDEWMQLTDYLGGGVLAALKMRTIGLKESDTSVSNIGFSGLPAGARNLNGEYYGMASYGYWWSSTEVFDKKAWIRVLNYIHCDVNSLYYDKNCGVSVRCIKN